MQRTTPAEARRTCLYSLVACTILVVFAILFVDRPYASWAYTSLRGDHVFVWLTYIADVPLPLSAIILVLAGIAFVCGWQPGSHRTSALGSRPGRIGGTLLAFAIATMVAIMLKDQLKFVFGRTWPDTWIHNNPSWVQNHVFGFFPFHGGPGWASFPSGHTTMIAAPMAVLWARVKALRALWVLLVVLVVVGLLGADYHFVSDCIAGAFLGTAVAAGILALLRGGPADVEPPAR